MLIVRDVVWSTSAKTLDIEANTLANALHKPKKVGVRMIGLKTTKSMKHMLKTAADPNLLIKMHIRMSLGWLSSHTNNRTIDPAAANALMTI